MKRARCSNGTVQRSGDTGATGSSHTRVTGERLTLARRPNLPEQPHCRPPLLRMHRQEVDDVGPVVALAIAVAHQAGRNRVAVGLVADQDATEIVASLRVEDSEQSAEVAALPPGYPRPLDV